MLYPSVAVRRPCKNAFLRYENAECRIRTAYRLIISCRETTVTQTRCSFCPSSSKLTPLDVSVSKRASSLAADTDRCVCRTVLLNHTLLGPEFVAKHVRDHYQPLFILALDCVYFFSVFLLLLLLVFSRCYPFPASHSGLRWVL